MLISSKRKLQIIGNIATCGTLIVVCLLVYRLWISNYFSHKAADKARRELTKTWSSPTTTLQFGSSALTANTAVAVPTHRPIPQEPFALIYIPRLRKGVWELPIFEGVDSIQLDSGIGHYPQSQLPGEVGNFSLFGHRTSHGQPFSNIEKLQVGDNIIVEMKDLWFVYQLRKDMIVSPNALWVTGNVRYPELGVMDTDPYHVITLITCEPRYSTAKRWVWWGVLQSVSPHQHPPPEIINEP